jgi:hypothetical protein
MSSQSNYFFKIPISQWDTYLRCIVDGIYGIEEGGYKVVHEHNGIRRIELSTNYHIPLIRSLPKTIRQTSRSYYDDIEVLTYTGMAIRNAIIDYFQPGGVYYSNPSNISIEAGDLKFIIYELAVMNWIDKFATLSDDRFIVYIHPHLVTALVKVVNARLIVNIYAETIGHCPFDVDDGYSRVLECLNPGWQQWKDNGDITAPICPPNYL